MIWKTYGIFIKSTFFYCIVLVFFYLHSFGVHKYFVRSDFNKKILQKNTLQIQKMHESFIWIDSMAHIIYCLKIISCKCWTLLQFKWSIRLVQFCHTLSILSAGSPFTFTLRFAASLKRYGPMMPPAHKPHQTVTFSGCIDSFCNSSGWSILQNPQFCLFILSQKWASSLDTIFRLKQVKKYSRSSTTMNNYLIFYYF